MLHVCSRIPVFSNTVINIITVIVQTLSARIMMDIRDMELSAIW